MLFRLPKSVAGEKAQVSFTLDFKQGVTTDGIPHLDTGFFEYYVSD